MGSADLAQALWRNQGQVLTPEVIVGLLAAESFVPDAYIDLNGVESDGRAGYVFHVERYAAALPELAPLHKAHWLETEKHRHAVPLNPDYDDFVGMDRAGRLLLFTIRKDGELVGQSTMRLHRSTHSQTLVSNEDSLFLRQDHRGGLMILAFIRYMDKVLTSLGVREVRVSSKLVNNADKLMIRAGFTPFATQLVKILGGNDVL